MSEWCINGKLSDMTVQEAVLKLIEAQAFLERYSNPHDKWNEAINIAIEGMKRYEKIEEIVKFGNANEIGFEYVGEKITEVIDGNDTN